MTKNVHIVIIDGARYSETFGDTSHKYIPLIWNKLRPEATIYTRHYNDSVTLTVSSHLSIITGKWQNFPNDGSDRSSTPTIFEYFQKTYPSNATNTFVILGKDKLDILSSSTNPDYGSQYGASVAFSNNQYDDTMTWLNFKSTLQKYHPRLTITNLGQVDYCGHNGTWEDYTNSIRVADSIIYKMWNLIQGDSIYKNKTTLIITNDHGRHIDDWSGHGDGCDGCRHIMMMILGPDSKKGIVDTAYHTHIDIAPTVGELLDFPTPNCTGTPVIPMQLPNAPVLSNLKDSIPLNNILSWNSVNRASSYHVQISSNSFFTQLVIDSLVQSNRVEIKTLSAGLIYYLRVCSINKAGAGAWSKSKCFKAIDSIQQEISLISPEDAMIVTDKNVLFSWKSSHNANHYYLQVATDSLMKNVFFSDSTIIASNKSQTISYNKCTLWWRVKAHYGSVWGTWSKIRQFTIIDTIVKLNFNIKRLHDKNRSIKIDLNLPIMSNINIQLYSISGLLLSDIKYNRPATGSNCFTIRNWAKTNGCYIVKLEAGPLSAIKRFQMYD